MCCKHLYVYTYTYDIRIYITIDKRTELFYIDTCIAIVSMLFSSNFHAGLLLLNKLCILGHYAVSNSYIVEEVWTCLWHMDVSI